MLTVLDATWLRHCYLNGMVWWVQIMLTVLDATWLRPCYLNGMVWWVQIMLTSVRRYMVKALLS